MALEANYCRVRLDSGATLLCTRRSRLAHGGQQVCVGDWVQVDGIDWVQARGAVAAVEPRRSLLQRPPLANADRVVVMSQGRIEQIGTPEEVYDLPSSPFVYGFIGNSCTINAERRGGRIFAGGADTGLAESGEDGPGRLHFRLQDVEFVRDGGPGISATRHAMRRLGGSRRVELRIDSSGTECTLDIGAEVELPDSKSLQLSPRSWRFFAA